MAEPRDRPRSGAVPQPDRARPDIGAADARAVELSRRVWHRWHGDDAVLTPPAALAVEPDDVARVLAVVDAIAAARRTEASR